ncbi:SdpI family protein [Palaeococcus ferrophilus]|uniref:DUF1648 domain-containing protein n=1 Tax=Palaeococcus ferrophilus TaxID=83868 RepID=UPI00064F9C24|nr:DUF1648 domain-containing protein [Palaeococcus ferrophilus]
MAGTELFEVVFGSVISAVIFVAGLLTYLFRNRPNLAVGFRIGYTFASEEAWRKANSFSGKAFMALGVLLFALSLGVRDLLVVTVVMLAGILAIFVVGYRIARRVVELEGMREPAEGTPKPIEGLDITPYLAVQVGLVVAYLVLLWTGWRKLPENVAIHFNVEGEPDNFASKSMGAFLLPLALSILPAALTYLSRDPMLLGRVPNMGKKGVKVLVEIMTLVQFLIVGSSAYVVLYNAYGLHSGLVLSAMVLGAVALLLVETFRLILALGEGD